MKQFFTLTLVILLCPLVSFAQLGNFHLEAYNPGSLPRMYEILPANPSLKGGPLKNLLIGKNYRREWITPVRVPVLDFQYDLGGITPKKEGGGRQTRSLEIEDGSGQKWVLRSVRKYPEKVVIPALQGTIAEKIVADGISASYPYAVLSVGTLASYAGVPYLPNTLVYIPNNPALGEFRETYRNSLALLEKRTLDSTNKKEKTYNTHEVVPKLLKSGNNKVDQVMVLKARLLDNFVMDFDRHEDQWEWVKKDSGEKTVYYPVAKDRDQAFFRITGLIPWVARMVNPALGQLQGLRAKAANINTFNFVAKDFDRIFLHELDEQTWQQEIDNLLTSVTDTVIEEALRRQPSEIKQYRAQNIITTLKEKRRYFKEDMIAYYRALSREVSVPGTNGTEQFIVSTESDGKTAVTVMQLDKSGNPENVIYQRSFSPGITREIRLYGLEGDDKFIVKGKTGMTVRLIGGPGKDAFINESNGGNIIVYDVAYEENTITGDGMKKKIDNDPMTNEYQRRGFQYATVIPAPGIELTREGGLFLGASLRVTKPGFRKEPYASSHFFYLARALESSSWHARYDADFIGIAKKTDLLFRSDALLPTVRTYFFGYGNNSIYNKANGFQYYLARYRFVDASLQVRYAPLSWLRFRAGPTLQYLQMVADRNKDRYISTILPQGTNGGSLYDGFWYGGGGVHMEMARRNHPTMTSRGIHTNLYAKAFRGLSTGSGNFEQVGGNVSFFTDFLVPKVLVLATSFGADHNWGDFQFPQAQYLGFRQNLRGYRFQRFAGRSRAYNNSEIRVNLGEGNFYFFKGLVGLIGFHDVGRVWADGENSNSLHRGWGGGVWVAPFNKVAIIGTLASSEEETTWLQVSFGFQF